MCVVLCGEAPWSGGGGWSLDEYFDFFFFFLMSIQSQHVLFFVLFQQRPLNLLKPNALLNSIKPQRNLPVKSLIEI